MHQRCQWWDSITASSVDWFNTVQLGCVFHRCFDPRIVTVRCVPLHADASFTHYTWQHCDDWQVLLNGEEAETVDWQRCDDWQVLLNGEEGETVDWQRCDDWQVLLNGKEVETVVLIDSAVMIDRCCWMARRRRLLIGRGMIMSSCSTQNPEWTKLTFWWRTVDVSTMQTLTATCWTTSAKVTWAVLLCCCCDRGDSAVSVSHEPCCCVVVVTEVTVLCRWLMALTSVWT